MAAFLFSLLFTTDKDRLAVRNIQSGTAAFKGQQGSTGSASDTQKELHKNFREEWFSEGCTETLPQMPARA